MYLTTIIIIYLRANPPTCSPVDFLTHVPHYLVCVCAFGAMSADVMNYVRNGGHLLPEVENFYLQTFLHTGKIQFLSKLS